MRAARILIDLELLEGVPVPAPVTPPRAAYQPPSDDEDDGEEGEPSRVQREVCVLSSFFSAPDTPRLINHLVLTASAPRSPLPPASAPEQRPHDSASCALGCGVRGLLKTASPSGPIRPLPPTLGFACAG